MKKYAWYSVMAVVIVVSGVFFIKQKTVLSQSSGAIETAKVKNATFVKTISSSGKTKAQISADLKFQSSGKLIWVGVKEGDTVKKGQILAQLDSRDVRKSLEKTLRDYSIERSDFEEAWRVNWPGAAESHESLTHAPVPEMKRILEKNQWNLEKAVLDVELKHLAIEYASLVSPIAGIVTHIDTPVAGVNITPAAAVFQVIDPAHVVFEAKIDEVDVGSLAIGQAARVSLDAYPEESFTGTIQQVSYAAETSAGGATVFPVEVSLPSDKAFRVGFNGDVMIDTVQLPDSLLLPLSAIREDGKTKYVFRKVGTGYVKQTITVGFSNDDDVIIRTGLSAGDEVVTKGFTAVKVN